jgi:pimeloyl-ACP methyl ester carboxylesterase
MAPVARGIADSYRVFEPFQSSSASTVADHVAELHEVVNWCSDGVAPALLGHSWGAMLALSYAAAHPAMAGPIILICSGTFDLAARERLRVNLSERMDSEMKQRFERAHRLSDPVDRFRALGKLSLLLYSCDLLTTD